MTDEPKVFRLRNKAPAPPAEPWDMQTAIERLTDEVIRLSDNVQKLVTILRQGAGD